MSYNWRKGQRHGANDVSANPQRLESADGSRWACGRNVKGDRTARTRTDGSGYDHVYAIVEVWTLKRRDASGKAVTVDWGRDRKAAEDWVSKGECDIL